MLAHFAAVAVEEFYCDNPESGSKKQEVERERVLFTTPLGDVSFSAG